MVISHIISDIVDVLTGGVMISSEPSDDLDTLNMLFDTSYVYSILYVRLLPSMSFVVKLVVISTRF